MNGTAVFQTTTMTLLSERNFAPARLIDVNTAIRTSATTSPVPLSRPASGPVLWSMLKFVCTQSTLFTYVIAAITSIGGMNTAWSQDAQPAVKPAIGPCE